MCSLKINLHPPETVLFEKRSISRKAEVPYLSLLSLWLTSWHTDVILCSYSGPVKDRSVVILVCVIHSRFSVF